MRQEGALVVKSNNGENKADVDILSQELNQTEGQVVFDDLFEKKIRSFLNAIATGSEAPIPTSQIIYNQAILDGIARSSKLGKEVEIEIPEI